MALNPKVPGHKKQHSWLALLLGTVAAIVVLVALVAGSVFTFFYVKYGHVVDARLKQPIFATTAKVYAAPREVRPGQKLTVKLIANELRSAGYTADGTAQTSQLGTYSKGGQVITVRPGPQSYHSQDGATIRVSDGVVMPSPTITASRCPVMN